MAVLPPTRAYSAKCWLLRRMGVRVSPTARVTSSVRIWGNLDVTIGNDSFLGHDLLITGGKASVTIGNCVDIGPRVTIAAGTHDIDMVGLHSAGRPHSLDVRIEDGAWIGAGTTILAGVTIGRKAVIAAGSLVTKDIAPFVVAAGAPCHPRKVWRTTMGDFQYSEAKSA